MTGPPVMRQRLDIQVLVFPNLSTGSRRFHGRFTTADLSGVRRTTLAALLLLTFLSAPGMARDVLFKTDTTEIRRSGTQVNRGATTAGQKPRRIVTYRASDHRPAPLILGIGF